MERPAKRKRVERGGDDNDDATSAAAAAAAATADGPVDASGDASSDSGTESDELDLARPYAGADSSSDDDGDGDSGSDADHIDVEFEIFDPTPVDFKSVRRLVGTYVPGKEASFDASAMAEAVIGQHGVGAMVKVTGDLDVYAFATVLPLATHAARRCERAPAALDRSQRVHATVLQRMLRVQPACRTTTQLWPRPTTPPCQWAAESLPRAA